MRKAPNVGVLTELQAAQKALAPAVRRLIKALGSLAPESLPSGALADLLYDLRATLSLLGSVARPAEEPITIAIKAIEEHFVQTLAVGESSGLQGMHSRVQVTESRVPTVAAEDWPKFYAHIKKTGAFELLNRAVNREAVRERWEAKKEVPGVSVFIAKRVSCTKLGGKGK